MKMNNLNCIACFAYCNGPEFSDRKIWANNADPGQIASSLIRVYIFWRFLLHLLVA